MEKAYRFRLYPTAVQENLIQRTFGCCRFVLKKCIDFLGDMLYNGEKERLVITVSVYTQRINNIVERLPETEQRFIFELVKRISRTDNLSVTNELNFELINQRQKETVKSIIDNLTANEPIVDNEFDEILISGISLRTPEELDEL